MKAINYHIKGIQETLKALFKGKFLIFFIPGVVITILYLLSLDIGQTYIDELRTDTGWSWIDSPVDYVMSGIDGFFDFILYQIYLFVVITFLSPFNTSLAEKFDSYLTGEEFEFNLLRLINDFLRMIFIVILAILLELTLMFLYMIISWIAGIPDAFDSVFYFIIAAFFFGFSFYDFALERYQQNVGGSLYYAFSNPLMMILTGGIFLLIFKIPIVGIPISVVLAVMISTVAYLYSEKKLPKDLAPKKINDSNV